MKIRSIIREKQLPKHKINLQRAESLITGLSKLLERSKTNPFSRFFVKNRRGGASFSLSSHDIEFIVFMMKTYSKYLKQDIEDSDTLVSTQIAANLLDCSRPHFIETYLKGGRIPYQMVGTHRRIRLGDIQRMIAEKNQQTLRRFQRLEQQALKKEEDDQNLLFLEFMEEPYDPKNPHNFSFDES